MIGFTCGVFDLTHAGHYLMFKEAKYLCDLLIVGIKVDPTVDKPDKRKPIQSMTERQIQVKSCKYVGDVVTYETEQDLKVLVDSLSISRVFMGSDHLNRPKGSYRKYCDKRGIEIVYTSRRHKYSTTNLIERIKQSK